MDGSHPAGLLSSGRDTEFPVLIRTPQIHEMTIITAKWRAVKHQGVSTLSILAKAESNRRRPHPLFGFYHQIVQSPATFGNELM